MTSPQPTLLWLRRDLRTEDHAALRAAHALGAGVVVPVFILEKNASYGGAQSWWLRESLRVLGEEFKALGGRLILRRGDPFAVLTKLAQETGAQTILWSRLYEPKIWMRDSNLKQRLEKAGFSVQDYAGALCVEPWALQTKSGGFYKVFTPFARACSAYPLATPCAAPKKMQTPQEIQSDHLDDWGLVQVESWTSKLSRTWDVGAKAGRAQLKDFIAAGLKNYHQARDCPASAGTSRLSPYLAWGQITVAQIAAALQKAVAKDPSYAKGATTFWREILWREFCAHLYFHVPSLCDAPLDPRFKAFPWKNNAKDLKTWQGGQTGYPLVDAGLRQLWATGWMHNRVRMVVASFLIKDMGISWREGAAWFSETLVDLDAASNYANWQWVAGCGADAAPFFRIFNPVLQSRKFDPEGDYIRAYVPELSQLSAKYIHEPSSAKTEALAASGVVLGQNYPFPCLDHKTQRAAALHHFKDAMKKT